ncbi:MAG: TIGR04255 family protein [Acidobacteriota bacterium]
MTTGHAMTTAGTPQPERASDRRYSRAPIVEAILDVRIAATAEFTLQRLSLANAGLGTEYPRRVATHRQRIQGSFSSDTPDVTAEQSTIGFVFVSQDGLQQYRVTAEGLTFNRLAPYVGWHAFRNEAKRAWDQFRSALGTSLVVSRVGLRYINKVEIPTQTGEVKLDEYFSTVPTVSPTLPQPIHGFFMRIELPLPDVDGTLAVVVAGAPSERPEHVGVLLDIDMFKLISSPIDEEELWSTIELLRKAKNSAFEACITDRTRELID